MLSNSVKCVKWCQVAARFSRHIQSGNHPKSFRYIPTSKPIFATITGARDRNRTCDLLFTRQLLCRTELLGRAGAKCGAYCGAKLAGSVVDADEAI